jgi:hypothetical protein
MDRIVLTASEGMLLTNGEIYATRLELGDWDSPNNYREITMDEYNAILQREENREIYDM